MIKNYHTFSLRNAVSFVSQSPTHLFWAFALMHLVLWTIVPSLSYQNLPLDVVEGYAWGKEWLIGTHKHPPLQAWILESLYILTGHAKWAPYLASQVAIVTAFWAVWQTGKRIAGETAGLIGALLLEGIVYYNYTSPEFNPNVLQIPFWALAGWSFYKAVKDNHFRDWLMLGIWAAAGMYSKYSTGLFLFVLFLSMLAHRDGRQRLRGFGPYLSLGVMLLLFAPHLHWLLQNDFPPLRYTQDRMEHTSNHYSAAITTLLLVAGQFLALVFLFFLMIILYDRRHAPSRQPVASFDRVFLAFAAFGPFIAMFFMSLVFGYHIRDMWETPFWNFIGLWAIVMLRPALAPQDIRRFGIAWGLTFFLGLMIFFSSEILAPYVVSKPKRAIFPGKHLTHIIEDQWHARYNRPLNFVIGDVWPAGNIAWYAADRPHVFMDGDAQISPWIDIKVLHKSGGVIVWCIKCNNRELPTSDMPSLLRNTFPEAVPQPYITLDRMTSAHVPPVTVGWAILPPERKE